MTRLAERLPERRFRTVKVRGKTFTMYGFEAWMPKVGKVRLVISREEDGFHFYVTNRMDWTDRQVLEAYKVRQTIDVFYRDVKQSLGSGGVSGVEGPISHYTLAPGLHRPYSSNPAAPVAEAGFEKVGEVPCYAGRCLSVGEVLVFPEACGLAFRIRSQMLRG